MKKKKSTSSELVQNRKAFYHYTIVEKMEAGIVLTGTEVKSLKNHGGSLQEAYVRILRGELWLIGAHIAKYPFGNIENHEEQRTRKLLVHRKQLNQFEEWVEQKGHVLVPLSFYLKEGKIKLCVGVGRGKKLYDKREAKKEQSETRRLQEAVKRYR